MIQVNKIPKTYQKKQKLHEIYENIHNLGLSQTFKLKKYNFLSTEKLIKLVKICKTEKPKKV